MSDAPPNPNAAARIKRVADLRIAIAATLRTAEMLKRDYEAAVKAVARGDGT